MPNQSPRVSKIHFVTGAAGFIGRRACECLVQCGGPVVGIGRLCDGVEPPKGLAAWVTASVARDSLAALAARVGEPDVIVHLAGAGTVEASLLRALEDYHENVGAIAEALEFARACSRPPAVILASSSAVYGRADAAHISEETPLHPVSPYGLHKWMAEELCRAYARAHKVPVAVVRLFSVYGSGLCKQLLWEASRRADGGQPEFDGTGDEVRDWLHVDDAARLLCLAAHHASADCPVVNGGTGCGMRVADVLGTLGACSDPPWTPRFKGTVRPCDPPRYVADIRRARAPGFEPQVGLDPALADYARWYREEERR